MITTGIPLATAVSTGCTRARASSGARTMPSTPAATALWTSWICWTRSSSFWGPCQTISTFPSSSAALMAPAWIVFQNSCVVPLGITMTRHFFVFAPERLAGRVVGLGRMNEGLSCRVRSCSRAVTITSPVEILPLDRLFLEVLDERLDAQLAHLERVLNDDSFDFPRAQGIHDRLAGVETNQVHAPFPTPRRRPRRAPPSSPFSPPPHPAIAAAITHRSRPTRFART